MERIFHHYEKWEDWKFGFYDNCTGSEKEKHIASVLEVFSSHHKTRELMDRVISEWPNSCEHNLSNESMNRIAYIGHAACCIYARVPSTVTVEAWNLLDEETQAIANEIALSVLNKWIDAQVTD